LQLRRLNGHIQGLHQHNGADFRQLYIIAFYEHPAGGDVPYTADTGAERGVFDLDPRIHGCAGIFALVFGVQCGSSDIFEGSQFIL
jgi:hypothetical protein